MERLESWRMYAVTIVSMMVLLVYIPFRNTVHHTTIHTALSIRIINSGQFSDICDPAWFSGLILPSFFSQNLQSCYLPHKVLFIIYFNRKFVQKKCSILYKIPTFSRIDSPLYAINSQRKRRGRNGTISRTCPVCYTAESLLTTSFWIFIPRRPKRCNTPNIRSLSTYGISLSLHSSIQIFDAGSSP